MERDYFARLSRCARWRMPPAEAEEFLADYREILEDNPRSEEELCRELGQPGTAVRLAAEPRGYYRWLAVFAAMALCLLLPSLCTLIPGGWWLFQTAFSGISVEIALLLAGIALPIAYFQKRSAGAVPRALPALMLVLLLLCAGVNWWVWSVLPGMPVEPGSVGRMARAAYELLGLAAAALGLFGLYAARVKDRRWRALYVLALTVGVLSCTTLMLLGSMDISADGVTRWDGFYSRCKLVILAGLAGTGVALC